MTQISAPWPVLKRDLIAILRGVKPDEVLAIGEELVNAGIEVIEVPLNSPEPFQSIELLAKKLPPHVLIGAGTVLDPADVARLDTAGGRLMISPNVDVNVLAAAAKAGMVTMPGVFTPTEALTALKAGASGLKFFPASVLGPDGIKAIQRNIAERCSDRRRRRRRREWLCRLCQGGRSHIRPRLEPI